MSLRKTLATCLVAGLACSMSPSVGFAQGRQQYQQMPPPATYNKDTASAIESASKAATKEAGPLSQQSKQSLEIKTQFYLAKLTEFGPNVPTPDAARLNLQRSLQAIVSPDGKAATAAVVADVVPKIVQGNFMPAAKIQALIVLSELDDETRRPASQATAPLYKLSVDENIPDHLRSLALAGLDRHIKLNGAKMQPAQRNAVAEQMVKLIKSKPAIAHQEEAHWWLVRRGWDVMDSLHLASTTANEQPSKGMIEGLNTALEQYLDPTVLPSIRLCAGKFLTRFDLSAVNPLVKHKIFLATAQLMDQEVVGWYVREGDKAKMAAGASSMGGMMGMMGGGGMPAGDASMMSAGASEGAGMTMGGSEGMSPGGMPGQQNQGPRPIDIQKYDLRNARRKLNTYCQLAHVILKGTAAHDERDFSPVGKGLFEGEPPNDVTTLPTHLQRPAKLFMEALDQLQKDINERSLNSISALMSRSVVSLSKLRDAAELIPPMTAEDGAVQFMGFSDLSPRMKSFKKVDKKDSLDDPNAAAPAAAAPAGDAAAPAGDAAAQPGAGQPGAQPPAAQPAPVLDNQHPQQQPATRLSFVAPAH